MDGILWTHTVPCSECQGYHTEYASRPQCQGCESLRERIKAQQQRANKSKPPKPQTVPTMHIPHKRLSEATIENIIELRNRGETYSHIAKVLRIPASTAKDVINRYRRRKNAKSVET